MTHFKVDIILPLFYNKNHERKRESIPPEPFLTTYQELVKMCGGISFPDHKILGSWISPITNKAYDDENRIFSVVVESHDKVNARNAPKIKKLIKYKQTLNKRFQQEEISMIATRCCWL